jgi:LmbE family N-acetylglucosaminyl deacetylase
MRLHHSFRKRSLLAFLLCFFASLRFDAQVRPINDYGALGLGHLLKRLNTTASVMMIGAHPDDEDSALLAYLARGEAARTAYLSLTRGEGGQNLIGPELFEPLGIIRTEELLQARRLDGAEQYFTRAYDFGFSKTLAEAKSKWPEDVIKCDVVRAIRLFRPMVVISRFTGTPADGHGHHQYAGYISPIAVKAASDPKQCTDAREPWQVLKFYVEQSFSQKTEPTLKINTGKYDPLLGRTYFEIAMEGRSMHRSQGEGRIEYHGNQFSGLNYKGAESRSSLFGRLNALSSEIGQLTGNNEEPFNRWLKSLNARIGDSRRAGLLSTDESIVLLADVYKLAYEAGSSTGNPESKRYMREIQNNAAEAICIAAGVQIDALADTETLVQGDDVLVSVKGFTNANERLTLGPLVIGNPKELVSIEQISLSAPQGWLVSNTDPPTQNNAGFNTREVTAATAVFKVKVDRAARHTQPYWLVEARDSDLFRWPDGDFQTLPFAPQLMTALVRVKIGSAEIRLEQPVQYRFADPARGEIRREVNVVPAVSVSLDRDLVMVPQTTKPQTRRLVVTVTNNTAREQSGHISLNIATSPDWKVETPQGTTFTLKTRGAKASIPVDITIPANPARLDIPIRASAEVGQERYALTMHTVAYPHIQTHRYYTPADATLRIFDLKTAPVKVGYIMGSGDEVPEAIGQMGMDVTMLEEKDLASGDLSRFDTIVVGIRASETRPDLVANNARLLEYAKNGGTVIMQYQRGNWTGLAPFPVDTRDKQGTAAGSIARVVDENAKVTILDPQHPAFNFPNKITDADFSGWVQERNAYNLVTFDPQYTPLLESHDAGEQENKGGLVIAKVGKGNWVYCSYSFFRQLPAGVPGAYRLFANLLSIPKAR